MRVAVVHHTLSSLGGGEKVFTYTVKALNTVGIVPDVYSISPVEPEVLREYYGVDVEYKVKGLWRLPRLPVFGIYQRFVVSYFSTRVKGYDVIVNTTGVYTPIRRDPRARYILYVYNPLVSIQESVKEEDDIGGTEKYEQNMFWRLYFKVYKWLFKQSVLNLRGAILVAVSRFTQERIRKYWGYDSIVVYPPVDIYKFGEAWDGAHKDGVASIGRFTPEKRHLVQLEIAKKLPDVPFRIIGGANTPYYRRYYEFIKARAEEMGLKNVEFYPNASFKKVVEILSETKLFIHTMVNEDFGLAPAEAVSGGVLPLVHDSGGMREVIPFNELRFKNVADAVNKIRYWHSRSKNEINEYRRLLRNHTRKFAPSNFMRRMLKLIMG